MEFLNALLPAFNILSIIVFVGLAALAAVRMIWRWGNFIFYGLPVPVLLKRDIVLFSALGLYFGSILIALAFGWSGLGTEWWWVMPRGIMVLAAMAYWVKIEYALEDKSQSQDDEEE